MKTKYILHGGSAQHVNLENEKFFREILINTKNDLKILLVHFASTSEKLESNWQRDTFQFNNVKENKNISFELANKNDFINQINNSDIIYFGGGTTVKLLDELKDYKNLKKVFENKIIAGESAGMNFLAKYCYSKSGGGIIPCLGILSIITIPHYQPGDEKKIINIPKDMEILLLPNYQYKVFEI